ncbi:MAG TPA: hypothetical protein VJ946_12540, partial [Bacteroidales bacterium]|nr:hypothetical protein [Bacteroidales bacterium]
MKFQKFQLPFQGDYFGLIYLTRGVSPGYNNLPFQGVGGQPQMPHVFTTRFGLKAQLILAQRQRLGR